MRHLALAYVVVAAAACSSKQGSYLVIDGTAAKVTFDRVELFVGDHAGAGVPETPATLLAGSPAPGPGKRFERALADTDRQTLAAPAASLDFFIPAGATLGPYVAAVAFRGDQPVAVGEVFAPPVGSGTLYVDRLELAAIAPGELELWGSADAPGCFRWSHARGGGKPATIVVVRTGDHDCDAVPSDLDCADLSYCAAGDVTCARQTGTTCFVEHGGTCAYGTCLDGVGCTPDTCLIAGACASACDQLDDPQMRLDCALAQPLAHPDYPIPSDPQTALACDPQGIAFAVPGALASTPIPCANPAIESPANGQIDEFQFAITEDLAGSHCVLAVSPLVDGAVLGTTDRHLLISIDTPSGLGTTARTTFVIGTLAHAASPPPDCNTIPLVDPLLPSGGTGSGAPATCGP